MRIIFVELLRGDTPEKVFRVMSDLGFSMPPVRGFISFGTYVEVDPERKQFSYHMGGEHIPTNAKITTLEELRDVLTPPSKPKPSYEWVERQLAGRTKQLLALGYTERQGEMMAPPLGKPPEYVLNDLSPEQAIQAFKEGRSVTVAGKPMTSGTTIEELLDSRLTLKHKRFGRIVLTDQVTDAPEVGTPVFYESIDKEVIEDKFATYMQGLLGSGCLHYTEQGAIDHAKEMARLNRDGFVEMDVEWLVKLKNELSTISHAIGEEHFSTAANKVSTLIEGVSKKIGEFYI